MANSELSRRTLPADERPGDSGDGRQSPALPSQRSSSPGAATRVELAGIAFDSITEEQAIEAIMAGVATGKGGHVITPNVDILRQLQQPELRPLADAELVLADGFPVVLASRLQGTPLPERVTGSSLIHSLARAAVANDRRVFMVGGASATTGQAAIGNIVTDLPAVRGDQVAHHCPPFGFERDARQREELRSKLREHDPHVVFVGLGFPKQDLLVQELRREFPSVWFVGCGAAIAMLAGEVSRAPGWMQGCGLEWLYRLSVEPRRMFRRYIIDDIPFTLRLLLGARRSPRGPNLLQR